MWRRKESSGVVFMCAKFQDLGRLITASLTMKKNKIKNKKLYHQIKFLEVI